MNEDEAGLINKLLTWIRNSNMQAAIAENPSVMTAAGWKINRDGSVTQERTKETDQLADNLTSIGETAVTAPTLTGDIGVVTNAIRHPIQTAKTIAKTARDAYWFLRNPKAVKVYHGTNQGAFDLRNARTSSPNNLGLHVTPNKKISEKFVRGNNGAMMEAYIPKYNMETIDIWANDYNLLTNNFILDARPGPYDFYVAGGDPELFMKLLEKYGANPTLENGRIYTTNRVSIPLQKETWPNMPESARKIADNIIKEGETMGFDLSGEQLKNKATRLNQQANNLFSDNGMKVIKYNNMNPHEGGGGISYMVTDPSVFYFPQSYNPIKIISGTKYPIIFGNEINK